MIVTVASLKGGVGKTALAVNLALALADKQKKVLAIDIDANNNLTDFFLRKHEPGIIDNANVYHVLTWQKKPEDCIYKTDFGVDVLPASIGLHRFSAESAGNPGLMLSLGSQINKLDYDLVVIDSPPYPGAELHAALWAADLILSPAAPVRWMLQGIEILRVELERIKEMTGRPPELMIVPSMIGSSKRDLARLGKLRENFAVTNSVINRSASIQTATETGKPLKENTKMHESFTNLAQEVLKWQERQPMKKQTNGLATTKKRQGKA